MVRSVFVGSEKEDDWITSTAAVVTSVVTVHSSGADSITSFITSDSRTQSITTTGNNCSATLASTVADPSSDSTVVVLVPSQHHRSVLISGHDTSTTAASDEEPINETKCRMI